MDWQPHITVATIVAPSAMKSEEGDTTQAEAGDVPTVGDDEAEGETAEGDAPRLPGFLPTILGALSEIPREQPIRENVEAIEGMSRRIRRMQHIVDAMKVEVEEQVAALFGSTFFLDTPTVARLEKWRAKAQDQAAARAGFAFAPYGHLKLSAVIEELASEGTDTVRVLYGHKAKAAVTLMTKSCALHFAEKGYGIRCNSVLPGTIITDINQRLARGEMPQSY